MLNINPYFFLPLSFDTKPIFAGLFLFAIVLSGPFSDQRKFTGHEYDSSTNLTYMDARYDDTGMGRF